MMGNRATIRIIGGCLAAIMLGLMSPATVSAEPCRVFIVTGQSNALGTTRFEGKTEAQYGPGIEELDRDIRFFWSNVNSTNKQYPPLATGDSRGEITTLQVQQGGWENPAFWGPEVGFARSLHGLGYERLVIIKAARGGGGNTLWDRATFRKDADAGHMWGHLADTVDAALAELDRQGRGFEVQGLLYLQGESNNADEARAAGRRLEDLHANLKTHINATYPEAADGMRLVVAEIAGSDANPSRRLTTAGHKQLAGNSDAAAFVKTRDLPVKQDKTHFGRDAKLQIGYRMGTAMHGLLTGASGIAWTGRADSKLWYAGPNWAGGARPWPQRQYVIDGAQLCGFNADNEVFTGRSLTLRNKAGLSWYRTNRGAFKDLTHRIDKLTLEDASIRPESSRNSVRHCFLGEMTLKGTNTFDMAGQGDYTVYLRIGAADGEGRILGKGGLKLVRGTNGTRRIVEFYADASGYSGTLSLTGHDDAKPLSLHVYDPSGWGTGVLRAGPDSDVAIVAEDGIESPSAVLELDADASLNLGTGEHVIGSLSIAGHDVPAQTYYAKELKQLGLGGAFSGTGTLTLRSTNPRTLQANTPTDP